MTSHDAVFLEYVVESSRAWADYAAQQPGTPTVNPLLVLQVRNTPDPNEIGRALDMIYERWPDAYRRAARVFSPDLARTYAEHLAGNMAEGDPEEALISAHVEIAALALVEGVREYLDTEADQLARRWLDQHRIAIKSLSDERQEEYRQIRAMSAEPEAQDLGHPREWLVASMARELTGAETPLPTYRGHLMCDENGLFPAELNGWEQDVSGRFRLRLVQLGTVALVQRNSVASDVHEEVSAMREPVVHLAERMDDEIDRSP